MSLKKYILKLIYDDIKFEEKRLKAMEDWNAGKDHFLYKEKQIRSSKNKIQKFKRYAERVEQNY